jgi:hypothetical protein
MNRRFLIVSTAAGAALGVAYTVSPLTVLSIVALVAVSRWAAGDLEAHERRWFFSLFAVAIVARLVVIGSLFLLSSEQRPFEVFFGDELFFKNRSLWIRNIGLGVPMSPADVIYAVEDVGVSSYLYLLAFLQALAGKAPYGIHVFNAACYIGGVLLLFRPARHVFGGVAALGGLAILLFTPSLFMWSISAIKEPLFTLAAGAEFTLALQATRSRRWSTRMLWLLGVIAAAVALESIRRGASVVAIAGVGGGYLFGYVMPRPKRLLATTVVLPMVVIGALWAPPIQQRVLTALRTGASYHTGHVRSPGHSYHALSGDYYREGRRILRMPVRDVVGFVLRSYVAYVTEPVPWRIESRPQLAYLPEQMFWYVVLALALAGLAAGVRLDAMMTMLLVSHAFGVMTIVALSGGNIGTLIRHRGLIFPYLAWLAGRGLYETVKTAVTAPPVAAAIREVPAHGHS